MKLSVAEPQRDRREFRDSKFFRKCLVFSLLSTLIVMVVLSGFISTTWFNSTDNESLLLVSITLLLLTSLFGCGVYSYLNHFLMKSKVSYQVDTCA